MSPRGGKCARVSKVAAKGRQARGQRSGNVFPDPMEAEETTPATSPSASAMPTTMMAMLVVTSSGTAAVATTGADKPAASTAACCNDEGRSQWVERMRQPQESSSEPARENGTPVHPRHPERSRRRERHAAAATATATATAAASITAAGRKNRPSRNTGSGGVTGSSCSSTSLSSPSSCASSRRSISPLSNSSSPPRSSTSSSRASDPLAIKSSTHSRRSTPERSGDRGEDGVGKWKRDVVARQDNEAGAPLHGGTAPGTATVSTTLSSNSSPFPSPVSTSSASCRTTTATTPRHVPCATPTSSAVERLRSALESYDRSRIYLAHVCYLDWRDLPGRRRDAGSERVWIVGAADHEGHHRTRLLVAGRHWRPRCLRRVNMLSQPVVYAGGGRGSLTADLFLWWFRHEFAVTAMAMHPDGAVLVAECADYLPPEGDCVAADGLVRLFVVPKDCMETRLVVRELRVRLATGILSRARCTVHRDKVAGADEPGDQRLDAYLRGFTLKEAFVDFHRAWLSVRSETFARSWTLPREREEHHGAILPHRIIHAVDQDEDRLLLGELQSLAREAGLDVDDEELGRWIVDEESAVAHLVRKREPDEEHCRVKLEEDRWSERNGDEDDDGNDGAAEEDDADDEPTAEEAVGLLSRVLTWMEREPLDPGLLLAVRSMRDTAAFMVSTAADKRQPLESLRVSTSRGARR